MGLELDWVVSTKSITIGTSCWIAVVKGFDKIERLKEEPKDRVNGKQKAADVVIYIRYNVGSEYSAMQYSNLKNGLVPFSFIF
jgi:hypothetical protein